MAEYVIYYCQFSSKNLLTENNKQNENENENENEKEKEKQHNISFYVVKRF